MAESTPGDAAVVALQAPGIAASVLAGCFDAMLQRAPSFHDWVDVAAARDRLGELSLLCAAWRRPAQRLHRSVWLADRDAALNDGHAAEVETIVWHDEPGEGRLERISEDLRRCWRATVFYCQEAPAGLRLPARTRAWITWRIVEENLDSRLGRPQLAALSVLYTTKDHYDFWPLTPDHLAPVLTAIGCASSLRFLALAFSPNHYDMFHFDSDIDSDSEEDEINELNEPWSRARASRIIELLADVAPNLRHLAFVDERNIACARIGQDATLRRAQGIYAVVRKSLTANPSSKSTRTRSASPSTSSTWRPRSRRPTRCRTLRRCRIAFGPTALATRRTPWTGFVSSASDEASISASRRIVRCARAAQSSRARRKNGDRPEDRNELKMHAASRCTTKGVKVRSSSAALDSSRQAQQFGRFR